VTQNVVTFPVGGGLDLVSPALSADPGRVIAALNYEPTMSGYRRITGYERYDGRQSPASATVQALRFLDGSNALAQLQPGDRITQGAEGVLPTAVGTVLAPAIIESGSFSLGDAIGTLLIVVLSGKFLDGRAIKAPLAAAIQLGTIDPNPDLTGYDAAYLLSVGVNSLRSVILPVPGKGPVRGIWFKNGRAYAVRDNADGTAGVPYYSDLNRDATTGNLTIAGVEITIAGEPITLTVIGEGWTQAANERVLRFTGGGVEPEEGDILVQTAQASAEVRRIILDSGTWAAGDAAGRIYLVAQSGAFTNGGIVRIDEVPAFIASADSITNAFAPGGRYSFISENFYGNASTDSVYGVNGVGPAFEYDGTAIVEIRTGVEDDRPTRIAEYKRSLFLAYEGGSVIVSEVGEPRAYNAATGTASEFAVGDEITDFLPVQNGLAVLCASSVNMLTGNDKEDFVLDQLSDEAGALAWTAQRINSPIYLDNRGLRELTATSAYGNFKTGTLSALIEPLLADLRRDSVNPTASLIVRSKSQYWLFLSNGTAIVFLFGKKFVEALPVNLGVVVFCAASVEDAGVERIFIGSNDGYVYEMNRGVSFDGRPIEHYLRFAFNNFRSAQQLKRAHKVTIDMETTSAVTLDVSVDIELGAQPGEPAQRLVVTPGGGALDSFGGNEMYFASQIETVAEAYLGISARNFSLKVGGVSATEESHVITGVTYHISPRGLRR
jgi:hypothetical protein